MSDSPMSKENASKRSDAIAEEAAEWFVALQNPGPNTKTEFLKWLKLSPEHVNEFLSVGVLWDVLPEVAAQPSTEELVRLAIDDRNVIALPGLDAPASEAQPRAPRQKRLPKNRTRRPWLDFAAAATLAAVVIGGVLMMRPAAEDPNLHSTAIGEQTSLALPDGSLVKLNTQTTIRVAYSEAHRDIELLSGEALFDVAKNPSRPFRVMTGHAVIQAVGTQFNVLNAAEDIIVTVVEGIVDVSARASRDSAGDADRAPNAGAPPPATVEPLRLTVGQQARVQSRSGEVAVVDMEIGKALAWQQRRLVFESLSLKEVIDEFNRYNDPPLQIDDRALEQLPISGVFRANDRESFVQFLTQMQLAQSHTRPDGTIVLRGMVNN
jgi:transmembrane sensor